MSDDLITWLRAQLDEDEAWARAACQAYPYASDTTLPERGVHWRWVAGEQWETVVPHPATDKYGCVGWDKGSVHLATVEEWPTDRPDDPMPRTYDGGIEELDSSAAGHIARHDPARVLAEVEAKRQILDAVERYLNPHPGQPCTNEDDPWESCELHVERMRTAVTPYVLPLLALPYADRPGYDEAWRP